MSPMKTYLYLFLNLILLSCCSNEDLNPESTAIRKACRVCASTPAEMEWLRDIVQENDGNIYAIATSDGVVIIHQPVVMSCLACVRYTCAGVRINSVSATVQQELQNGIRNSNLIYEPTF